MGFLDKLRTNVFNSPSAEPLFGGLIPRRFEREDPIVRAQPTTPPPMPRPVGPIRQNGLDRVSNNLLNGQPNDQPNKQMNTVIDWTPQRLDLEKKKQDLEREKLDYEKSKDTSEFGLKEREQVRKETDDKNKLEVDHRKQALDEWKTQNPEGQVETDENGRIVIIDKRTGKSIDTGLTKEHLSEEKKLELQAKNAQELESLRQKNRIALEGVKDGKEPKAINPTQQRVAEDDAAAELLRDPRYSFLKDNKIINFDKSTGITIDNAKAGSEWKEHVKEFERELKIKSGERMNKTLTEVGDKTKSESKTVSMVTPSGETIQVPEDEVDEAKSKGAKMEGDKKETKPDDMKSAIELIRDSGGRVVYAGNVKGIR